MGLTPHREAGSLGVETVRVTPSRLQVSKEPAILHDGDGSGIRDTVNYPIGLTKPSLGALN